MFCANCGKEVQAKRAEFCPFCGEILEKDSGADIFEEVTGNRNGRSNIRLRTIVISVLVGVLVLAAAIWIGLKSSGLDSWECDRCHKEWYGHAYRGKGVFEVFCEKCADACLSPSKMDEYLIKSSW